MPTEVTPNEPPAEPPAERPFPERVQKVIDAHNERQKKLMEKRVEEEKAKEK